MANFVKLSCNTFNPQPKPQKVIKPKKGLSYKKKPTGEKEIFEKIWEERGPYSEISNEHLGEFCIAYFAHILPKGQNKYPKFKLEPLNICIMSFDQHHLWDNDRSKCAGPEWRWLHEEEDILKERYAELHPSK